MEGGLGRNGTDPAEFRYLTDEQTHRRDHPLLSRTTMRSRGRAYRAFRTHRRAESQAIEAALCRQHAGRGRRCRLDTLTWLLYEKEPRTPTDLVAPVKYATPEQKKVPVLHSRREIDCSMTEPGAAPTCALKASAVRDGDDWILAASIYQPRRQPICDLHHNLRRGRQPARQAQRRSPHSSSTRVLGFSVVTATATPRRATPTDLGVRDYCERSSAGPRVSRSPTPERHHPVGATASPR